MRGAALWSAECGVRGDYCLAGWLAAGILHAIPVAPAPPMGIRQRYIVLYCIVLYYKVLYYIHS